VKPKWQRARILVLEAFPECVGRELWVRSGPPHEVNTFQISTNQVILGVKRFSTNLLHSGENGIDILPLQADPEKIELLPDFAEDVPLIPWEQFLAECRAESRRR
jgi:hypothetical protein